ncbi:MAG: OsmC family protein [Armatimonadota bacterium]|nr:OsmC family protein [Armatimonadota bacterium]MDR7569633.1 OsmC family protein [Armatimonadota bacterium]MDR7614687.1 OsmC family protein [Armatimonadota bacterium]
MSEEMRVQVRLEQEGRYRFRVDLGRPDWNLVVDEPPPLGEGAGPNPARLLATAVGHCLGSSLQYCLERARVSGTELSATVEVEVRRNERGRWRVAGMRAELDLSRVREDQKDALARCLALFEDFCIITASVRQGIPVAVGIRVNGERISGT